MVDFSLFRLIAVFALFAGHILLLAPIFDRLRKRAESRKVADPELTSLDAELLARRLLAECQRAQRAERECGLSHRNIAPR